MAAALLIQRKGVDSSKTALYSCAFSCLCWLQDVGVEKRKGSYEEIEDVEKIGSVVQALPVLLLVSVQVAVKGLCLYLLVLGAVP